MAIMHESFHRFAIYREILLKQPLSNEMSIRLRNERLHASHRERRSAKDRRTIDISAIEGFPSIFRHKYESILFEMWVECFRKALNSNVSKIGYGF